MRYWVYINDKVEGPFEKDKIAALEGFTPDTLVCSEVIEDGETQEWLPAKTLFAEAEEPAAEQPPAEEAEPEQAPIARQSAVIETPEDAQQGAVAQAAEELPQQPQAQAPAEGDALSDILNKINSLAGELASLKKELETALNKPAKAAAPASTVIIPAAKNSFTQKHAPKQEPEEITSLGKETPIIPELKDFEQQPEVKPFSVSPLETQVVDPTPEEQAEIVVPEEITGRTPKQTARPQQSAAAQDMLAPAAEQEPAVLDQTPPELIQPQDVEEPAPDKEESVTFEDITAPLPAAAVPVEAPAKTQAEEKPFTAADAAVPQQQPVVEKTKIDFTKYTSVPEVNLTEATSLISDFIPPSDLNAGGGNKKDEGAADIIANTSFSQGDKTLNVTQIPSAITEQPKPARVKASDLKTAPLISAGARAGAAAQQKGKGITEELKDMDQFGTIEESEFIVEPEAKKSGGLMKFILLLIVLAGAYAGAVYMGYLPDYTGFIKPAQPVEEDYTPVGPVTAAPPITADDLMGDMPPPSAQIPPSIPAGSGITASAPRSFLDTVKNYKLSNGVTLKTLIDSKHPSVKDFIEWTETEFDDNNYSIFVKVPPEKEMTLRTIYRFNYNIQTKALTPTITDSRNLLESIKKK